MNLCLCHRYLQTIVCALNFDITCVEEVYDIIVMDLIMMLMLKWMIYYITSNGHVRKNCRIICSFH